MAAIFAFKCNRCSQVHEGSPSFAFRGPDQFACLSDEQKKAMVRINEDFCVIARGAESDHFVRAVLEVPIHGVEEPFLWGIWVSLSKKSFDRYFETFDDPVEGEGFFGWICNDIAVYPYGSSRAADVLVQGGNQRPKVVLHRGEQEDDQLVIDQVEGISIERAQYLAERALHERPV